MDASAPSTVNLAKQTAFGVSYSDRVGVGGPTQRFCDQALAAGELWTLLLTLCKLTIHTSRASSRRYRTTGANACAH